MSPTVRDSAGVEIAALHIMTADGGSGAVLGKQVSTELVFRKTATSLQQAEQLFWAEPGMDGLSDGYVWCLPRELQCDIWSRSTPTLAPC